jgi:hypothetical protein
MRAPEHTLCQQEQHRLAVTGVAAAFEEGRRQWWVFGALKLSERGEYGRVARRSKERTMAKRTTHRSSKGTKLYAVRGKKGEFKDIQTYKRAHGQDVKRKSKKEK